MIIAVITTILFHLFMVFLSVYVLCAHVDGGSLYTCGDHKSTSGALSPSPQSISRQDLSLYLEPLNFLVWLTRDPSASSLHAQCSTYRHVPPPPYTCARVLMHV